jgi:hypothetical protein
MWLGLLAKRPSTQISKPVAALAPEMGVVLVWPVLSSVARALISYSFMIGKLVQNGLVRFLMHTFGSDRYGAACTPFQPRA